MPSSGAVLVPTINFFVSLADETTLFSHASLKYRLVPIFRVRSSRPSTVLVSARDSARDVEYCNVIEFSRLINRSRYTDNVYIYRHVGNRDDCPYLQPSIPTDYLV